MRIIAGAWRGRRLTAPKGDATRPTADRTREALFSMLVSQLGSFEGLRFADLFAGSGALGFEGLSRGAASCTFVEQDSAALYALRANAAALGVQRADIRAQSVMALGPVNEAYDVLLLDAPYQTGAGGAALDRLLRLGWLAPGGLASVESSRDERVEVVGLELITERSHGKAKLTLLRRPT